MSKRKIKKFLKRVAPLALAGFGAAMLGRRNQMKDFLATEGGDRSNMFIKPNMLDIAGPIMKKGRDSILADPRINKMDLSEVLMKKGGRVKKKGFAKKKKQANKMRKK